MCGVVGIISKQSAYLGNDLINMLKELLHRGKDSTGMALYEDRKDIQIRVALSDTQYEKDLKAIIAKHATVSSERIYQ